MRRSWHPMIWAGLGVAACWGVAGGGFAQSGGLSQPAARSEAEGYEVRACAFNDGWQAIRFSPSRGDSWIVSDDRWVRITDQGQIPPGRYDVLMLETGRANWSALRVEKTSGRAWFASQGRWTEISAP
jgi:hypothetical protein